MPQGFSLSCQGRCGRAADVMRIGGKERTKGQEEPSKAATHFLQLAPAPKASITKEWHHLETTVTTRAGGGEGHFIVKP